MNMANMNSYQNSKCSRTDMDSYQNYLRMFALILIIMHIVASETSELDDQNTIEETNWNLDLSNLRTWRWNRKSLAPVLIGLAAKGLILIPLALTGLAIMGSIAILTGKLSLFISAFMFLKRFFSSDRSTGGFFGLNPLGFPRPTIAHHHNVKGFSYPGLHNQ